MTFDEWFDVSSEHQEKMREQMRMVWDAAQLALHVARVVEAPGGGGVLSSGGLTLADAVRWEQRKQAESNMPVQVGDHWLVKVRGGTIESYVIIASTSDSDVWVVDPPKLARVGDRQKRRHRKEDLEFLKLLVRGLK